MTFCVLSNSGHDDAELIEGGALMDSEEADTMNDGTNANSGQGAATISPETAAVLAAALGLGTVDDDNSANQNGGNEGTPATGTSTATGTDGDAGTPGEAPEVLTAEGVTKIIDERMDSAMDRLLHRLSTPKIKHRLGTAGEGDDGGNDGAGGDKGAKVEPSTTGPTPGEIRDIKLAYRDRLDGFKFLFDGEQTLAATLSESLITAKARAAGDIDYDVTETIGAEVAATVREQIDGLRKQYAAYTQDVLKAQGLLLNPKAGQGTGQSPHGAQSDKAKVNQGAEIAARRHPKPAN